MIYWERHATCVVSTAFWAQGRRYDPCTRRLERASQESAAREPLPEQPFVNYRVTCSSIPIQPSDEEVTGDG
jgi:hypothetical protein